MDFRTKIENQEKRIEKKRSIVDKKQSDLDQAKKDLKQAEDDLQILLAECVLSKCKTINNVFEMLGDFSIEEE
ncbi:MAG: hypothetical protein ACLUJM_03775 [Finegoldia sp.]|uniref:hypothetical protein n=1 Tax=Finegoldia sp. TaxID=1981334 RepID=UPI0039940016